MKGFLAALALTLGLASTALAADAVFYINRTTGSDAADGLTPTTAWRTMAAAATYVTANGAPGGGAYDNLVLLISGSTGATPFALPNFASAPSGGKRYYIYGNVLAPALTPMVGGAITVGYQSIRGVQFTSGVTLENGANRDTVADFLFSSQSGISVYGGDYNWIGRGTLRNHAWEQFRNVPNLAIGNVFWDLTVAELGPGQLATTVMQWGGNGGRADSNEIGFCRLTINMDPAIDISGHFWINYYDFHLNVHDTKIYFNGIPGQTRYGIHIRDSSSITLKSDTLIATTGCNYVVSTGTGHDSGSPKAVTIDSCYIANGTGDGISFHDAVNAPFKMTHTVVVAAGKALEFTTGVNDKVTVRRCTLVGNPFNGIVQFSMSSTVAACTDTIKLMDNILYSTIAGVSGSKKPPFCGTQSTAGCYSWALKYPMAKIDSLANSGGASSRKHIINFNDYAYYGDSIPNTGDRSINDGRGGTGENCSRPGNGSSGWTFRFCKLDSASLYGGPDFDGGGPDTSFAAWMNPALNTAAIGQFSSARAHAAGGADCGAKTYVGIAQGTVNNGVVTFPYGTIATAVFTVTNGGTGTMTVTSVTSSNSAFTVTPQTGTIAAGATQIYTVTYNGASIGSSSIVVVSDSIAPCTALAMVDSQYGGPTSRFPADP